jgi:hypothetical protein
VGFLDAQYAEIITAGRGIDQLIDDRRALVSGNIDLGSSQRAKANTLPRHPGLSETIPAAAVTDVTAVFKP